MDWKTVREKEKMLVTFSPFLNVFKSSSCGNQLLDLVIKGWVKEIKSIRITNSLLPLELQYILNQKRNFRKIGLRGGHTRYERRKKSTPTSNETEISNEINDIQTVHEL